jgi:PAS domain S-box-containing protein
MKSKSPSFFDRLLSSGVTLEDPEKIRKIRALNQFELVFIVAVLLVGLFYYSVGVPILFEACLAASFLGVLVLILLRSTKNPKLSGNFAVFVLWAALVIIRWNTGALSEGGLNLLIWVWNTVIVLLAVYMTGYLWGSIWACVVLAETGLAVFLYKAGYAFPNLLPLDISPVYGLGAYLTGLLGVLLFAFLYEKERFETLAREEEKAQTLDASRKYLEDILEHSPVPTFVLDSRHRVVQWNHACQELTDIPAEEILGKAVWEGLHLDEEGSLADKVLADPGRETLSHLNGIISETDDGGITLDAFLPNLKGGLWATINSAPILEPNGAIRGAIQTIQELSEKKGGSGTWGGTRIEKIESATNPIFRVDSQGKISSWNKACEGAFGFPASRMLGESPTALVAKPDRTDFRETITRVLQGESFNGKEWKYYTDNGEPVYVLARLYSVGLSSGDIRECVIINTDITRLKLRLTALERSSAENKEKLKTLLDEYNLLKSNIARFIRKKEGQ